MFLIFSLFLYFSLCQQNEKNTLVLLQDLNIQFTHSAFFSILRENGHKMTILTDDDENIELEEFGEYNYDNLILIFPSTEYLSQTLSVKNILNFVNDGNGNLFVVASNEINDNIREISNDCSIEFDVTDSLVVDHFSYDSMLDDGTHTTILSSGFYSTKSIGTNFNPVIFRGLGMSLDKNNHLLIPILSGSKTSFSKDETERKPHVSGESTTLIAGLQTRRGSRITFVGSLDMLSNKFFDAVIEGKKSGNEEYIGAVLKWSFQDKGVLRYHSVNISPPGEDPKESYKISTMLRYSVIIEEWNGKEWSPFVADDVQMEFSMIDPYIRKKLPHKKDGLYEVDFQIPDKYGVFKCVVDYRRKGYSILKFQDQVTVRPVRTNEFERFIKAAFPYYISVFLMMAGFFIFVVVFINLKDDQKDKKE